MWIRKVKGLFDQAIVSPEEAHMFFVGECGSATKVKYAALMQSQYLHDGKIVSSIVIERFLTEDLAKAFIKKKREQVLYSWKPCDIKKYTYPFPEDEKKDP